MRCTCRVSPRCTTAEMEGVMPMPEAMVMSLSYPEAVEKGEGKGP